MALWLIGTPALISCEVSDSGQLAVTWRFNGHAGETGANPCGGIGANRVVIEMDGPSQFSEVVACNNVDPDYPMLWVGSTASLPVNAYGRLMRSVPRGTYTVTVFFIDAAGNPTAVPAPLTDTVTIRREKVARIDMDFPVSTGAIGARWRIAGTPPNADLCSAVGAASIRLQAIREGEITPEVEITAECRLSAGAALVGLEPGDYSLSGQLLDAQGSPITEMLTQTGRTVTTANSVGAILSFPWESFTAALPGNLRFTLGYGDTNIRCSEVEGLAAGPLSTRLGLTDPLGAAVTGLSAYANPDGLAHCDGLTLAQPVDGLSLSPCLDHELIICGLQAGSYALTVASLDASDLVCFGVTTDLEVAPLAVEEPTPEAVVLATSDATACWE